MTERPLLILPEPAISTRAKKTSRGGGPKMLSSSRQQERLGPRLNALKSAFEEKRLAIKTSATGLVPEDVLVLETAGTVEEFFKAVSKVDGLEFLGEFEEEDIPPDDDFFVEKKKVREGYRGRVYLIFANQQAFRQLLNLWATWQKGDSFDRGLTKWRDVFALLRDIRPWSINDRLEETGVLEDWRDRLEWDSRRLPCEIELWYRSDPQQRQNAVAQVRARVEELDGEIESEAIISEIHYHALTVKLPITSVEALLNEDRRGEIALVQSEQIQFFRASSQMAGRIKVDKITQLKPLSDEVVPVTGTSPVVALLDGLPLQSHQALAGRLTIDDPDDFGANYEARLRVHGTAMASLIIWGDLHTPGTPIPQPLYVRPIMQPFFQPGWEDVTPIECVSESTLIVDLIHRAVRRMFEGEKGEPPTAPNISVTNLSIGIRDRPFEGTMSPLARLLDWLSWKYNVLFLVSAGNHVMPVKLGTQWSELASASANELYEKVAKAIASDTRNRRLLSPAEAMNVLTVGSLHEDGDTAKLRTDFIDPTKPGFPSPINGQGQGYKRSIKPDILAPGGRIALKKPRVEIETELQLAESEYIPGQLVATPGPVPGVLNATAPTRGTSNATALIARAAALIVPLLEEMRGSEGGHLLEPVSDAVLLKTLLVHGAHWGEAGDEYLSLFKTPENGNKISEYLTRFLGFGGVDLYRVQECTETRVTALAGGTLAAETGAVHRFPLPPSLSGKRGWRRLVVTLAWMTPIHNVNQRWRRAHLWFTAPESKLHVGSNKHLERRDADWQAVQRGTVQHEVFEGKKAAAFVDGDEVVIQVSCREDAKVLTERVPYGLAVTLEIEEGIGIDIYSEIRERVLSRVQVQAGGNG